jgi:hypothetical protein
MLKVQIHVRPEGLMNLRANHHFLTSLKRHPIDSHNAQYVTVRIMSEYGSHSTQPSRSTLLILGADPVAGPVGQRRYAEHAGGNHGRCLGTSGDATDQMRFVLLTTAKLKGLVARN